MAKTPFSLLLRLSQAQKPSPSPSLLLLRSHVFSLRPFSTSPPTPSASDPSGPPARTSLSARMSFVFDQIDAIEKDRSHKDEALQRIRAWRDAKAKNNDTKDEHHPPVSEPEIGNGFDSNANRDRGGLLAKELELVHPWKEWVELMERLVQQNYFDHRRKDEDGMVRDLGFDMSGVSEEVLDFTRDFKTVQAACLNFGRDRFDIMRSLSRQDIQLLVGYGCPTVDKKVVFSAKLLRKHVHLDEGDVCSSCALRSSCERAYLVTNKEDEARTFDVMRILLTFGFDPVNGLVANKALLKLKSVKNAVRKMLHEVVKLSGVPIDPNLPPPIIRKPPPKVKQQPPPPRKRVGRDDIEMKKGDWLCPKCDFMNFAKNTMCLQCDAKRPKRQLLPGEWECPECNFLNYRRNTACFHCECKRPPDEYTENFTQERQHFPKMRTERVANRQEASNSWNFDFDDAESDGADVAAFEYADSPRMDEQLDGPAQGGGFRESGYTFHQGSRSPRSLERDFPNPDHKKPRVGFDDFDDEDDDDVDSYELDSRNSTPVHTDSFNEFPEARRYSESEDFYGSGDELHSRRRMSSSSNRQFKQPRRKAPFSGSEDDFGVVDSDEDLPVHPNWKSSHVADFGRRSRGGRTGGSSRRMNFSSEEEHGLSSGSDSDLGDDFPSRRGKGNKRGYDRRGTMRGGSNFEDEHSYGSDSNDKRFRGNRAGPNTRGSPQNGRESFGSSRHTQFRSGNKMENRGKFSNDNFDRSHKGAYGNDRGYRGGAYDNDRGRRGDSYSGGRFDDGNGRGHRGGSYGSDRGHNYSGGRFDGDRGRNYSRDRPQRHAFDRDSERGYRGSNRGRLEFVDRDNDYGRDRPRRRMAER